MTCYATHSDVGSGVDHGVGGAGGAAGHLLRAAAAQLAQRRRGAAVGRGPDGQVSAAQHGAHVERADRPGRPAAQRQLQHALRQRQLLSDGLRADRQLQVHADVAPDGAQDEAHAEHLRGAGRPARPAGHHRRPEQDDGDDDDGRIGLVPNPRRHPAPQSGELVPHARGERPLESDGQ